MNDVEKKIPFRKLSLAGNEVKYLQQSVKKEILSGDGDFAKQCCEWIKSQLSCCGAFLTGSCTAALEMAANVLDIRPGDEVILPSFTYVSTASAFLQRGAVPVFVDIRKDTLNLDEKKVDAAITKKTKAIVPVHYAGVACEMDAIMEIASCNGILVVEDAAQAFLSTWKARALGTIGALGAFSFHETKNIVSGEGGAISINDQALLMKSDLVWQKGTNRGEFLEGTVDRYKWQIPGSSYAPSELTAAFLYAQFEKAKIFTDERRKIWNVYHNLFRTFEHDGLLTRPFVPEFCEHNGHMYFVLLPEHIDRQSVIHGLSSKGIQVVPHYVPLHTSPAGRDYGRCPEKFLPITDRVAAQILRLPLWVGLNLSAQEKIVECLIATIQKESK